MVVNHEVGHFLGNGHAVCPRKGALAPVMARQSFGLEGCVADAWPYPDGRTFVTGPRAPRRRPRRSPGDDRAPFARKTGAEGNVCAYRRVLPGVPGCRHGGCSMRGAGMTRIEQDRRKRQMNRRIREVLAVRRMMRSLGPIPEEPSAEAGWPGGDPA